LKKGEEKRMEKKLRILVIMAHPDDSDINCGGLALKYTQKGHIVKFVSTTNGGTGHYKIGGIELIRRRYEEAQNSAKVAKLYEYQILDWHTGELEPIVEKRKVIIKIIRDFIPDLIITHRPYDYHPDHRYTSQLVQDASYILTVPNMLPLTEYLKEQPVICYSYDGFKKPLLFQADIVIGIDDVIDKKLEMLHCHTSQMYEWLPFNEGKLDEIPKNEKDRKKYLFNTRFSLYKEIANKYREKLVELYGEKGKVIKYAEAFEISEYGKQIEKEEIFKLFPFF